MDNNKWILAGVALLVLFQLASFFNIGSVGVGTPNIEDYDPFIKTYGINTEKDITTTGTVTGVAGAFSGAMSLTSTFKLGSSGTTQANQVITTCSMTANNVSAGTTTQYAYCTGVTGVTSSDLISASFATSTTAFNDAWQIVGAKASSTAGAIDFVLIGKAGVAMSAVTTVDSTTVIRASH